MHKILKMYQVIWYFLPGFSLMMFAVALAVLGLLAPLLLMTEVSGWWWLIIPLLPAYYYGVFLVSKVANVIIENTELRLYDRRILG